MSIDPLWIYIAVPAAVVSVLILIKVGQRKAGQSVAKGKPNMKVAEKVQVLPKGAGRGDNGLRVKVDEMRYEPSNDPKPENCTKYLGYLYFKKAPDQTPIPSECYQCKKLLKCVYSPHAIEKVYGK